MDYINFTILHKNESEKSNYDSLSGFKPIGNESHSVIRGSAHLYTALKRAEIHVQNEHNFASFNFLLSLKIFPSTYKYSHESFTLNAHRRSSTVIHQICPNQLASSALVRAFSALTMPFHRGRRAIYVLYPTRARWTKILARHAQAQGD